LPTHRTVLAVVLARLRSQRTRLLAFAGTEASRSSEVVHDTRVALRRLAAVALLSRGVPARGDGEPLRIAARDLRRRLTPARTAEVCRELLLSRASPGKKGQRARSLADELFPVADGPVPVDPEALREVARLADDRMVTLRNAAASAAGRARLERRLARRVERRCLRAVERLARRLPPRLEDIHRVRILAKQARYALEAAQPFLTNAVPILAALEEMQETAGDAHDLQELEAAITAASRGRADVATLQGEIRAEAVAAAERAQESGRKVLSVLSARPPKWRRAGKA
jgi:CHAD domain-containing protein